MMFDWWMTRSFWTRPPSEWHLPHRYGMRDGCTGERGSLAARISCVPWQLLQCGASGSPRAIALPCSDASCCTCSAWWQLRHCAGFSVSSCGSSFPFRSAWQSVQSTLACTALPKRASSTKSETVRPSRFLVSPLSLWQAKQSSLPCASTLAAAPDTNRSTNANSPARRVALSMVMARRSSDGCTPQAGAWPDSSSSSSSTICALSFSSSSGCSSSISRSVSVPFQKARLIG